MVDKEKIRNKADKIISEAEDIKKEAEPTKIARTSGDPIVELY